MIQLALDRNVTMLLNCKLLCGVNTCFKFYIEVFINIVNYDWLWYGKKLYFITIITKVFFVNCDHSFELMINDQCLFIYQYSTFI